jgi:hypothetical protein
MLAAASGAIFIATPHHGSWLVNQMQKSDVLERLINPTQACRELAVASPYLARLNERMRQLAEEGESETGAGGGDVWGGRGGAAARREGVKCLSFGETAASKLSKWPVRGGGKTWACGCGKSNRALGARAHCSEGERRPRQAARVLCSQHLTCLRHMLHACAIALVLHPRNVCAGFGAFHVVNGASHVDIRWTKQRKMRGV